MSNESGRSLTPQQELFCQAYALDPNGTQAAIKAGYSENSARQIASENLSKPYIQDRVNELLCDRARAMRVTADAVLAELHRIATADISLIFNEKGELRPIHEIPSDVRKAIASVEIDELFDGYGKDREQIGLTKKIKFWDRNRALEMLAKNLKLLSDKIEVTGRVTLEDLVAGSVKKDGEKLDA